MVGIVKNKYQQKYIYIKYIFVVIACVIVFGCSTADTNIDRSIDLVEKTLKENEKQKNIIPTSIMEGLLNAKALEKEKEDERFDISVRSMPAKVFFIGLVGDSKMNIVTHPDIEGKIDLDLKNVTIDEVLSITRDIYGYEYKKTHNVYSVYPRALRTEMFEIDYLDVERRGKTNSSVLIGSISSGSSSSVGNSNQQQSQNEAVSSGSEVQTNNETDFWKELAATIEVIVNTSEEGKQVVVTPQAGIVVVTALPKEINAVRRFLERSELNVARQVILEAKIVEVKLSDGFETGINWNQIQGQMLLTNNVSSFQSPSEIVEFNETNGSVFSSIFRIGDMSRLLSLLETQGAVQVLSSPRVSTVNNQKALIRVGSDEFFVTGISNQTTTSAATTSTAPNIELTSFFSGISLDVTPQISEDDEIILHVHPIVSNVIDQNKDITVGNDEFSLPLALREIRESDSIVKAKSGQVIVLGGLMQEQAIDNKGGRPGLSSIPGLSSLFKTRSKATEKTELVILLRPIVVKNSDFTDQIDETYNRIKSMSNDL